MKTRITTGLVALVVLVAAFAAVAVASTTTNGKVSAFTYDKSTKVGRLTVLNSAGKKVGFRVPPSANCGVSQGQSGDQIPCKTLGASKYHGKKVTVTWTKSGSTRVASVVAVHL
jgi:hypothetical protein